MQPKKITAQQCPPKKTSNQPTITQNSTVQTNFSLDQSYKKFAQLRKKLRNITENPLLEANGNQKAQPLQICEDKFDFNSLKTEANKSKQIKPASLINQETQRKKRRGSCKQISGMESKEYEKSWLQQKQQTLSQINRLLELKTECLNKIEQQLKRQRNGMALGQSKLEQTQRQPCAKVKAPDLYQIRQQRRKLKQNRLA